MYYIYVCVRIHTQNFNQKCQLFKNTYKFFSKSKYRGFGNFRLEKFSFQKCSRYLIFVAECYWRKFFDNENFFRSTVVTVYSVYTDCI